MMNRRTFQRTLLTAAAAGSLLPNCNAREEEPDQEVAISLPSDKPEILKPKRLKRGDTVGLITPGSYARDTHMTRALANMKKLGLKVVLGKNIRAKRGYNAGTDQQRLEDLHSMFANPEIDAIWCVLGGYGCTRLLPMIDYELIRNNPKILIGYSDITALSNAIFQRTGLVGFHGPVGLSTWTSYALQAIQAVLMEPKSTLQVKVSSINEQRSDTLFKSRTVRSGTARGILVGGNLSILAAMAGTPFEVDVRQNLLFLEDVEEKPYSIDRMLTQLRQAEKSNLGSAAGFALGIFNDCVPEPNDDSLSLMETIEDRLLDLKKPAAYGLSIGHISNQAVIPVGIEAELDADQKTITLLEAAVV